jgi:hypothetical protein
MGRLGRGILVYWMGLMAATLGTFYSMVFMGVVGSRSLQAFWAD